MIYNTSLFFPWPQHHQSLQQEGWAPCAQQALTKLRLCCGEEVVRCLVRFCLEGGLPGLESRCSMKTGPGCAAQLDITPMGPRRGWEVNSTHSRGSSRGHMIGACIGVQVSFPEREDAGCQSSDPWSWLSPGTTGLSRRAA